MKLGQSNFRFHQPGLFPLLELSDSLGNFDNLSWVKREHRIAKLQHPRPPLLAWVNLDALGVGKPTRFATPQQLWRYYRLGIRDRSSDGKPLGFQQLDRCVHVVLKAISYRVWLVAVKQKRGTVYEFYTASLARTGDEVHARLNTQRKILHTLLVLWQRQREFEAKRFLGIEAQPTAKAQCG